jgi:Fe-S oxidoreductase
MKFEVLHIVEFLEHLIKSNRLKFSRPVPLKVTYHDPCHIGRHLKDGLYDQPRNVLKSLPGIELVEMERIRENSWCCGAGGGVKQANPELALWSAHQRIQEARITGAAALVTSCGWCLQNFKDAAEEFHEKIEVYDVAELVARAI